MPAKIKIYTKTTCPACVLAKETLKQKNVSFEEVVLDDKPEELKQLIEKTQMKTVPQIFINDQFIGGCSDMLEMDRENKLDILLQANNV